MQDLPQKAPQQMIVQAPESKALHDLKIELVDENIPSAPLKLESTAKESETKELAAKESPKKKGDAYEKLPCSETDKQNVHEIITTIAENGKLSLLFKQNELKALGSQINHLHPLKFLSAIFSNPVLKERMGQIFGDYFKRNAFMTEVAAGLNAEAEKGGLEPYIERFAKEVNVPAAQLRPFFNNQDWEGLVEFLIQG